MVYDRPMNLFAWITSDGGAYTVQRAGDAAGAGGPQALFHGHAFHSPNTDSERAVKCVINSRFSLIAVCCSDASVYVYSVRDYSGGVNLSHRVRPLADMGNVTSLRYSPDGYCLFVGYERGWSTWSVFGQPGGSSSAADVEASKTNHDSWLTDISAAAWLGNGTDLLFTVPGQRQICILGFAKSAATGCFTSSNFHKALLQTSDSLMVYQGHNLSDITAISGDISLWQTVQIPHD